MNINLKLFKEKCLTDTAMDNFNGGNSSSEILSCQACVGFYHSGG